LHNNLSLMRYISRHLWLYIPLPEENIEKVPQRKKSSASDIESIGTVLACFQTFLKVCLTFSLGD
jgi:hypothetical protein